MASSKGYLDFIMEQLSGLDDISCRITKGKKEIEVMKRQALYGVILPYRACMILVLVERGVFAGAEDTA